MSNTSLKKVLVIIHLARASPRLAGLVKFLPEFGWQPIILTAATNKYKDLPATIIETPYRSAIGRLGGLLRFKPDEDIRRQIKKGLNITTGRSFLDPLFNFASEVINYPCPDKNWKPYALLQGQNIIQNQHIDALLSTSPPIISHIISQRLKTEFKIPWLADLRDLWSQNAYYVYSGLRRCVDRRLERRTLSHADVLTTISEPMADSLRTLHGKPVFAIPSGFDLSRENIPPAKLTEKFTITYTGSIYPGKRDPIKLFEALRELIGEEKIVAEDIEIRFYGPALGWLIGEATRRGLSGIVRQHGSVTEATALEKQNESQVLVLFDWDDPKEKGVYTGKIFEYLGARRPIIATGGVKDNVIDSLLGETKAGEHALTVEQIKTVLMKMYLDFKKSGTVEFKGDIPRIRKYSQQEMAKQFGKLLSQIFEDHPLRQAK